MSIDQRILQNLQQLMPRLFMAEVLRQHATEAPNPDESLQDRLNRIITATAENTNSPWGANGAYLGTIWTNIVGDMATNRPEQLAAFVNAPELAEAFRDERNASLLQGMMNPAIMGATNEGRDLRSQVLRNRGRLEDINETVDALARSSGVLANGESLEALVNVEISEIRRQDAERRAADPNAQNLLPTTEEEMQLGNDRPNGCEQFIEMLMGLIQQAFGGEEREQGNDTTPAETSEDTTPGEEDTTPAADITIPTDITGTLRDSLVALDANNDGKIDAAEQQGVSSENLEAALGAVKTALGEAGVDVSGVTGNNLNGQGGVDIDDLRSGLEVLQRARSQQTDSPTP